VVVNWLISHSMAMKSELELGIDDDLMTICCGISVASLLNKFLLDCWLWNWTEVSKHGATFQLFHHLGTLYVTSLRRHGLCLRDGVFIISHSIFPIVAFLKTQWTFFNTPNPKHLVGLFSRVFFCDASGNLLMKHILLRDVVKLELMQRFLPLLNLVCVCLLSI
jgi:hypothetical protein